MTREEAIKILKAIRVYECYPKSASEETKEAIDMAIEALNSVTDSENGAVESKNDVIKRQDAIKTVIRMCSPICDWELEKKAYTDCVIDEINSLPSAETIDCTDFVLWLLDEIMDEENWELNAVANGEIIARKLKKLGLLEVKDGYYVRTPSAEAVEVVRCKDCLMTKERDEYTGKIWCCRHREYMDDMYYCADGLRREDGEA